MLLTVQNGQDIRIVAEGPDSEQAVDALRELSASNFEKEPVA